MLTLCKTIDVIYVMPETQPAKDRVAFSKCCDQVTSAIYLVAYFKGIHWGIASFFARQ
jgi:hypothetical protein